MMRTCETTSGFNLEVIERAKSEFGTFFEEKLLEVSALDLSSRDNEVMMRKIMRNLKARKIVDKFEITRIPRNTMVTISVWKNEERTVNFRHFYGIINARRI